MKRVVLLGVLLVSVVGVVACGGDPPAARRHEDWRHPRAVCTADEQCHGGACVMEVGATEGVCRGGASMPPGGPGSAAPGRGGPPPGSPNIQPGPGDIQL